MAMDYRKEFLDREYTSKESYSQVWRYATGESRIRVFHRPNGGTSVDPDGLLPFAKRIRWKPALATGNMSRMRSRRAAGREA